MTPAPAAYDAIIEHVFFARYKKGAKQVAFEREELIAAAKSTGVSLPRNLGDVVYTYRYRRELPERVRATCAEGEEWIIRGVGAGKYQFLRVTKVRIEPQRNLYTIKVPDATPEIVAKYALTDEQALLAKVRYNRLIDLFTGIVAYSLQNHLRTQVEGVQMETDELYIGVSKTGAQFVLPVQAKGGSDRLGRVQLEQDVVLCRDRFPDLVCRPIAAQFMADNVIAMFELTVEDEQVRILEERHYKLVPASEITPEDLERMRRGDAPPRARPAR
jgi:hypothetical protein